MTKDILGDALDWNKGDGLLPAIIQHAHDKRVLMLGYMNQEAFEKTVQDRKVTFFSRSKNRLWMKGESSGNVLMLESITVDCDRDTILIQALPAGPTCHTGADTCFDDNEAGSVYFLQQLADVIATRKNENPNESYTAKLFKKGTEKISQKVGEEGVEVALAHMSGKKKHIKEESADLLYHLLVLLESADVKLSDVCDILVKRQK